MRARWWPIHPSLRVPSTRIRGQRVIEGLRRTGVDAGWYAQSEAAPDVLVLGKRYDGETMAQAAALRGRGTRVVLDLCDNHFYFETPDPAWVRRAESLRRAIRSCDAIAVSTPALAEVVRAECAPPHLYIIGDAVEQNDASPLTAQVWRHPLAELALRRLSSALGPRHADAPVRLLWFGHHGSDNAAGGLLDLLRIVEPVGQLASRGAVSLTVISNNLEKFRRVEQQMPVACHYLAWHESTFARAASMHDITVIPVTLNPFSRCKSNNRVATAFMLGLPVVADPVPSYVEFSESVRLDNWSEGLLELAADPAVRAQAVESGREHVRRHWQLATIVAQWREVLGKIAART